MLDSLITSKTRLQLVLHFFLNPDNSSYLRRLAEEFGESTNAIRVELNRLEEAKLLNSNFNGRQKWYYANKSHPLFPELNSIPESVNKNIQTTSKPSQNLINWKYKKIHLRGFQCMKYASAMND